ncbi:MAG TPA: DUF1329 domain-containing protein [Candidatus Binataceae bacterium]|nr:DUF1329 domain-containing protein [Candidatus Binataceae bacterium]
MDRRTSLHTIKGLILAALLLIAPGIVLAQNASSPAAPATAAPTAAAAPAQPPAAAAPNTIPVGTIITTQNWRQYSDFMPEGMAKLFGGEFSLKVPDSVQMEIGPTEVHPLPKPYVEATEKYSGQVRVVELPDGGLNLQGYQAGQPFPNPADPHKGWKILANLWYRYIPYIAVDTRDAGCVVDGSGSVNCKHVTIVRRQMAYITEPGVPPKTPGSGDKFFSQWLMVTEPEQSRYTATLTVSYEDLTRPEDAYIFLPSMRRYQPISTLARCSPNQGTDSTFEEYRAGFDSNMTEVAADFVGAKKIIALLPTTMPAGQFPADFEMPLGWPKPSWGKWQVRDVNVLNVTKLPSHAKGYCYGKRAMYIDAANSAPLWEDLYDNQMKLWRLYGLFMHPVEVPNMGIVDTTGAVVYAFWDVQNNHSTFFIDPSEGSPMYVNEQVPKDYLDLSRYTEPSGLNLIMR